MWLIPTSLRSRFSLGEAASISGSDSPSEGGCEFWVTVNGKPSRRPFSWRGWKTRAWSRHLFSSATSPAWTPPHFGEWIWSSGAFLVSLRQRLDAGAAPQMSAGSGPSSRVSFAQLGLDLFSSRTSEDSSPSTEEPPSQRLWTTWPISGSMQSGMCFRRARSGHPIAASGSSSWPTPDAQVFNDAQSKEVWAERQKRELLKGYNGNGGGTPLGMVVRMWWGTPTEVRARERVAVQFWSTPSDDSRRSAAADAEVRKAQGHMVNLQDQAATWKTPRARADKMGQPRGNDRDDLQAQAASFRPDPEPQTPGQPSSSAGRTSRPRLNEEFVEWLMGLPAGWSDPNRSVASTDFASWATESSRWLRHLRSVPWRRGRA